MTSVTSSMSGFDMYHITSLSVLRTRELETIAAFVKLLSDALEMTHGMGTESPYMVIGGLRFLSWTKVIPVVELYCIFNSTFQEGACKPIPSEEDRGYYNFVRNSGSYRFRPATYRKTADRLLIGEVKKLIKHKMAALPAEITEIGMTETSVSLVVLFHFRNCSTTVLAVALTPAIAGTDLPEGTNNTVHDLFLEEWEDGGPGSRWFLVPPPINLKLSPYSWELAIPNAYDLIHDFKSLVTAALLLCYVAEVRQWTRMGLQSPHNAIWAVALSMDKHQIKLLSTASLRDQLSVLLERLRAATRMGELPDFAVPLRNYLDGTNKVQRSRLAREFQKGLEQLSSVDCFLETFVGDRFPLPLPEYAKSTSAGLNNKVGKMDYDEGESELSTDTDFFSPSDKVGTNDDDDDASPNRKRWNCTDKFPRLSKSPTINEQLSSELVSKSDSHESMTDLVTLIILLVLAVVCLGIVLSAYGGGSQANSLTQTASRSSLTSVGSEENDCDYDGRPNKKDLFFPLP